MSNVIVPMTKRPAPLPVKDFLETLEESADRMADALFFDNQWHCAGCGRPIPPGEEVPLTANPYAPPACRKCAGEICGE